MIKIGAEFGFLDSENESGDEEEEGGDDDSSEISVLALNARLREACRKSGAADPLWPRTTSLGVTTSGGIFVDWPWEFACWFAAEEPAFVDCESVC